MNNSKYQSTDDLKRTINPIDFYTQELQEARINVRKKWAIAGLCPFHEDRRIGSFYINTETGGFICHSCGNKGGDIIAFVRMKYQLPFKEAVQKLINEWRR